MRFQSVSSLLFLFLAAAAGCASEASDATDDDSSAQTAAKVVNQSGRASFKVSELHDPIADAFLHGSVAPPKDFKSVVARLVAADTKSACSTDIALVSERAQLLGKSDAFRAVLTRRCGTSVAFLSPMQTLSTGKAIPTDVEMMGFDEKAGLFNF